MELKHYPRLGEDFEFDRARVYDQTRRYDKPDGLWVSVAGPDDWPEWTQSNEFRGDETVPDNEWTVTLAGGATMRHLGSVGEIRAFTNQYKVIDDRGGRYVYRIDWPRLASECDGVIITPYQWTCRNLDQTFWYYGWDCASGCIWNLNAIASVEAATRRHLTADCPRWTA